MHISKIDKRTAPAPVIPDNAMVVHNASTMSIFIPPKALALKKSTLKLAAKIEAVTDAKSNEKAVEIQTIIAGILKEAETVRVEAKKPILDRGKIIDNQIKEFIKELGEANWRLGRLTGEWRQLEDKRMAAEQAKANEELSRLERERAEATTKVQSVEELDAVNEQFDERAKAAQAPVVAAPAKVTGQTVRTEIKLEVFDINALYLKYPGCVRMEPNLTAIKALLDAKIQLPGVRSWTETVGTVRTPAVKPAINV
jgi:hypothetical protein